jgi:choline kinase
VAGYRRAELARDLAGPDVTLAFNPFFRTTNTLVSLWMGLDFIREECVALNADVVFDERILEGLAGTPGDVVLACDRKRCGEEEVKFRTCDGALSELNKSVPPDLAEGEFTGLWKMSCAGVAAVREAAGVLLEAEQFNEYFEAAIERLIGRNDVALRIYDLGDKPWCEIDFPHDYETARRLFEGGSTQA